MDENLQAELTKWLKTSGEFISTEAPQYATDYVNWYFTSSAWAAMIFAFMMLAGAKFVSWCGGKMEKGDFKTYSKDTYGYLGLCGMVTFVLCFVLMVLNTSEVIRVRMIPRTIVLEHIRSLTK